MLNGSRAYDAADHAFVDAMMKEVARLLVATVTRTRMGGGLRFALERLEYHADRQLREQGMGREWIASQFGVTVRALNQRRLRREVAESPDDMAILLELVAAGPRNFLLADLLPGWTDRVCGKEPSTSTLQTARRRLQTLLDHLCATGHIRAAATGDYVVIHDEDACLSDEATMMLWMVYRRPGISGEELAEMMHTTWETLKPAAESCVRSGRLRQLRGFASLYVPSLHLPVGDGAWRGPILDHLNAAAAALCDRIAGRHDHDRLHKTGASTFRVDMLPARVGGVDTMARMLLEFVNTLAAYKEHHLPDLPVESADPAHMNEHAELVLYMGRVEIPPSARSARTPAESRKS
jgi:hypothetical protein